MADSGAASHCFSYVGHLEAFDWNLLRANLGLKAFHAEFDRLFAFGIDPVDGKVPADQPSDWPRMQQVEAYRDRIREELSAALSNTSDSGELTHLLNISIEHRLMHAETLEYSCTSCRSARRCRREVVPMRRSRFRSQGWCKFRLAE